MLKPNETALGYNLFEKSGLSNLFVFEVLCFVTGKEQCEEFRGQQWFKS